VSAAIESIVMPKWGMTMTEGTLIAWLVEEGATIAVGDEVAEVETEKMLGSVEAHAAGNLRRRVAAEGEVLPIGAVLGLIAEQGVSEAELDAFLERAAAELAAAAEVDQGPREIFVKGKLGEIHAIARGEGEEAVVLLHGFSGDALNWRFVIDELAAGRTVIAVDLPGHGASTKEVGSGSAEELGAAVLEVMDAEGIERAHLVGHSLGGLIAATLAATAPDRVASLALIAPAGLGEEIDAEFIDAIVAGSSRRDLKRALPKLFADQNLVTRELVEEVLRYKRAEGVAEALEAIRGEVFSDGRQARQVRDELGALQVPLLVVWGAEDEVIPSAQSAAAPGSARVEVLVDVGHSPHVESPAAVSALINDHLEAAS
jgi:pyruvate dehydrogenase E2 component (dihydrolipoyllysine-residue acetyltransferase)